MAATPARNFATNWSWTAFGDVHALDRDAQLAAGGEAGPHRTLGGAVQVGVVEHDHGVLAAQLERAVDQAAAGLGAIRRPDSVEPVNMT